VAFGTLTARRLEMHPRDDATLELSEEQRTELQQRISAAGR
jgi:hypothetical protein